MLESILSIDDKKNTSTYNATWWTILFIKETKRESRLQLTSFLKSGTRDTLENRWFYNTIVAVQTSAKLKQCFRHGYQVKKTLALLITISDFRHLQLISLTVYFILKSCFSRRAFSERDTEELENKRCPYIIVAVQISTVHK